MKRLAILGALWLLLLLAGCGGNGTEGPPEIRYGEDVCEQCQMIISEPRFAGAYVTVDGIFHRFDDIGEMFLHAHERQEEVGTFWVHDYHAESWLEGEQAKFVVDPGLQTPMGWGIAAFAEQAEASAYQTANGGVIVTAEALRAQIESGELRPAGLSHRDSAPEPDNTHDQ